MYKFAFFKQIYQKCVTLVTAIWAISIYFCSPSLRFQTILIQIETYAQKVISASIIFSSLEKNTKLHSFKIHLESQLKMKFFLLNSHDLGKPFTRKERKKKKKKMCMCVCVCATEMKTVTVQKTTHASRSHHETKKYILSNGKRERERNVNES